MFRLVEPERKEQLLPSAQEARMVVELGDIFVVHMALAVVAELLTSVQYQVY